MAMTSFQFTMQLNESSEISKHGYSLAFIYYVHWRKHTRIRPPVVSKFFQLV